MHRCIDASIAYSQVHLGMGHLCAVELVRVTEGSLFLEQAEAGLEDDLEA